MSRRASSGSKRFGQTGSFLSGGIIRRFYVETRFEKRSGWIILGEGKDFVMRNTMIAGSLALGLLGSTGCATHKYVAKSIAPVESHVSAVESKNDAKNADQD